MLIMEDAEGPLEKKPLYLLLMDSPPILLKAARAPLPSTPSPASHSWTSNPSPFLYILYMLAFIGMITLIYAVFFVMTCPPNPFQRLSRSSTGLGAGGLTGIINTSTITVQLVSGIVYKKEESSHGSGSRGECPVCLTAFIDGEVIREVNVCKHLFHAACIDMWLCSHSNCPVCRAFIATKRLKPQVVGGEDELRPALPADSASLV